MPALVYLFFLSLLEHSYDSGQLTNANLHQKHCHMFFFQMKDKNKSFEHWLPQRMDSQTSLLWICLRQELANTVMEEATYAAPARHYHLTPKPHMDVLQKSTVLKKHVWKNS